ncbi:MAG TPA: DUF3565 domain-containing protein [Gemmatimonadaceae bacterium]
MRFSDRPAVSRTIIGFHKDVDGDWVADLDCGHGQHVRHDPPWQNRPWVGSEDGRARFIGTRLECVKCGESL